STASVRARSSRPSPSSARTGWHVAQAATPGFPGAAWSSERRALCDSRQASACSRAPEPTRSTFTAASLLRALDGPPGAWYGARSGLARTRPVPDPYLTPEAPARRAFRGVHGRPWHIGTVVGDISPCSGFPAGVTLLTHFRVRS